MYHFRTSLEFDIIDISKIDRPFCGWRSKNSTVLVVFETKSCISVVSKVRRSLENYVSFSLVWCFVTIHELRALLCVSHEA